jgi:hypothetical protein
MDWGEAWRLTLVLASDPSSYVAAVLSEWKHPLSWESIALRDLYDLQHASKSKRKPKPYARPWDRPTKTYGGTGYSVEDYMRLRDSARDN